MRYPEWTHSESCESDRIVVDGKTSPGDRAGGPWRFLKRRVLSAQFFLLIFIAGMALALSVDVWMTVSQGRGMCTTLSCEVVGEYVRWGELALTQAGAVFFLLLWLLAFFAGRYRTSFLWPMFAMALLGALAFDGALLGFQFMGLGERCQLCIAIGLGLFLILLQYGLARKSVAVVLLGLSIWTSGFAANTILKLDPIPPRLEQTSFLEWPEGGDPWTEYPSFHLFVSLHCGHCAKVLGNLSVNDLGDFPWSFHIMDNKPRDLSRIAHFLASNATMENPFLAILEMEMGDEPPKTRINPAKDERISRAKDYFRFSGYRGVPMLMVDLDRFSRVTLVGATAILAYLENEGLLTQTLDWGQRPPTDGGQGSEPVNLTSGAGS
ncbi:MAG: hypothetical protein EOM25_01885 [Deltaproteobacteria bacterium]|nr:hypothetical protein [Deltaproteobacteria bacterium]